MSNLRATVPPYMVPGLMPRDLYLAERSSTNHIDCLQKTVLAGVVGFGAGGVFGLFMASMAYDNPFGATPAGQVATASIPVRRQIILGFKDMGLRSWSMARNFGKVGAMFAGIECGIEGLRARTDGANSVMAGCLTGGILARNAGPAAAATGCAAFAAFSAAIDAYMRYESPE